MRADEAELRRTTAGKNKKGENGVRYPLLLLALVAILVGSSAGPATADSPNLTWRHDILQPLDQSHLFFDYGTRRSAGGCTFQPGAHTLDATGINLVRQLAVDFTRCIALTEEGVAGPGFRFPDGQILQRAPAPLKAAISTGLKLARPVQQIYTVSGYTRYTYTNALGQLLTQTEADITWTTDMSCAQSVSGGGQFTWASDWNLQPGGYYTTELSSCVPNYSFGYVRVYGTFQGNINPGCYHYYQPATALGRWDATIDYGLYSVSANCGGAYLQLFKWAGVPG